MAKVRICFYFYKRISQKCAMIKENFIKIYEESFKENWALPALTDYGKSKTFTFGDVATGDRTVSIFYSMSAKSVVETRSR